MKGKHFINVLALIGALFIIVGVTAAANSALVGDLGTVEIPYAAHR